MTRRLLCALAVTLVAATAAAEVTRTLEATLPAGAAKPFAVENLAGTMTVLPGPGDDVTAVATIHAQDEALAASVRFEQVRGKDGRPTLRVIYPLSGRHAVRYPGAHGSSRVTYDDQHIQVSSSKGDLLWAEVEVRVPAVKVDAVFRNAVGILEAHRLDGRLVLDAGSGDIRTSRLTGEVKADTGSGDIEAETLSGSFECDTGSGDCLVTGFDGETLSLDTGSGDVTVRTVRASRVTADTGSGDVELRDADVEAFEGETGSGEIVLDNSGGRLREVDADTGSGSLTVRLPPDSGFELRADTGSGDVTCGFDDARAITHGREVVGWERGDRRIRIKADTGSGDVTVAPLR